MIEKWREGGGRGYALGALAIFAVTFLGSFYMVLLLINMFRGEGQPLTTELLSPFGIIVLSLGGLGGATQLPNVAERWTGKFGPSNNDEN